MRAGNRYVIGEEEEEEEEFTSAPGPAARLSERARPANTLDQMSSDARSIDFAV